MAGDGDMGLDLDQGRANRVHHAFDFWIIWGSMMRHRNTSG